ncbi:MAG: ferritin-like domain-containing protein [Pseudomonadota bacterium]
MKESPPMGMNRTGIQMSPFDSNLMQSPPPASVSFTPGDSSEIAKMRMDSISEAEPLGSVPMPGTISGAITTGVSMLTGNSPQIFLDKLGERLAFERTGTRLYDALITKCEAMDSGIQGLTVGELRQIRTEEARHFLLIADAIERLGGDPTAETPSADLAGVESIGMMQIVTDPRTTMAQSLHAMLAAEMVDNAGWELLIALAESNQQTGMSSEFSTALAEERTHLQRVQAWYESATLGTTYPDVAAGGEPNPAMH